MHKKKTFILLIGVVFPLSQFSGKVTSVPFSGFSEEGLQSALGFVERNREKENKLIVRRKM